MTTTRNAITTMFFVSLWACGGTSQQPAATPAAGAPAGTTESSQDTPPTTLEKRAFAPDPAPGPATKRPILRTRAPTRRVIPHGLTAMFQVGNFAKFKAAYDKLEKASRAASVLVSVVMRDKQKPNLVIVHLMATDDTKLRAFVSSRELGVAMQKAGAGRPTLRWTTQIDTDPPTPSEGTVTTGVVASFEVRDFARWLRVFKTGTSAMSSAGVIGHVIARGPVGKRTTVLVILAGTDAAKLEALVKSSDTAKLMQQAGVIGQATIKFVDVVDSGATP